MPTELTLPIFCLLVPKQVEDHQHCVLPRMHRNNLPTLILKLGFCCSFSYNLINRGQPLLSDSLDFRRFLISVSHVSVPLIMQGKPARKRKYQISICWTGKKGLFIPYTPSLATQWWIDGCVVRGVCVFFFFFFFFFRIKRRF